MTDYIIFESSMNKEEIENFEIFESKINLKNVKK